MVFRDLSIQFPICRYIQTSSSSSAPHGAPLLVCLYIYAFESILLVVTSQKVVAHWRAISHWPMRSDRATPTLHITRWAAGRTRCKKLRHNNMRIELFQHSSARTDMLSNSFCSWLRLKRLWLIGELSRTSRCEANRATHTRISPNQACSHIAKRKLSLA